MAEAMQRRLDFFNSPADTLGIVPMHPLDGKGKTLYLFGKDKAGKSACYSSCAANWPPSPKTPPPGANRRPQPVRNSIRPNAQ